MMPHQSPRRGRLPRAFPLRLSLLGEESRAPRVEEAPRGVRLTRQGLFVVGVLAALAFCVGLWVTLWLVGSGYFFGAIAVIASGIAVIGVSTKYGQ